MTKKQISVACIVGIIFAAPMGLLAIKGLEKLIIWLWPNCEDPLCWALMVVWVMCIALVFPVVTLYVAYSEGEARKEKNDA